MRDVGDVHPDPHAVAFAADGDRVVEVLGRLRVDRERGQIPEVDAPFHVGTRRVVGLELAAGARLDQQAFEHGADVGRLAEDPLEARAAAPGAHDGEVARVGVAEAVPVDRDRQPRREIRLADDELAPAGDLEDDEGQCAVLPARAASPTESTSSSGPGRSVARTSGRTPIREMSTPAGVR